MSEEGLDGLLYSLKNKTTVSFEDNALPSGLKYSEDSAKTLTWLRNFTQTHTGKFDIEGVIKQLSVKVHYEDMGADGELSGYLEERSNGWHIGINKYEVSGRQRFTLAHELAHLLFHTDLIRRKMEEGRFVEAIKLFRSKDDFRHEEMEANTFAAELLMPSSEFRSIWNTETSLRDISEYFEVSRYAAEFRAKKFGLPKKED